MKKIKQILIPVTFLMLISCIPIIPFPPITFGAWDSTFKPVYSSDSMETSGIIATVNKGELIKGYIIEPVKIEYGTHNNWPKYNGPPNGCTFIDFVDFTVGYYAHEKNAKGPWFEMRITKMQENNDIFKLKFDENTSDTARYITITYLGYKNKNKIDGQDYKSFTWWQDPKDKE